MRIELIVLNKLRRFFLIGLYIVSQGSLLAQNNGIETAFHAGKFWKYTLVFHQQVLLTHLISIIELMETQLRFGKNYGITLK